jgi:hypothetical protein
VGDKKRRAQLLQRAARGHQGAAEGRAPELPAALLADGKQVAYLQDRAALHVLDIASGKTREVMSAEHSYSYEDGDQWFDWAPDGRACWCSSWTATAGAPRWAVPADGSGKLLNLTHSGYEDLHPLFARQAA